MRQMIVYITGTRRVVVYPGGGCHLEDKVPNIGWCIALSDWDDNDTRAMQAAGKTMTECLDKLSCTNEGVATV